MIKNEVHPAVLYELYNFINSYFEDRNLADYIFDIYAIDNRSVAGRGEPLEKFLKILNYLQNMSGDMLICFHAGRHFGGESLFRGSVIPGVRFSAGRTFSVIDVILNKFFSGLVFRIEKSTRKSIVLVIDVPQPVVAPNYFFIQYLKGILSSVPNHWLLPSAQVSITSYPFSLEELLRDIEIPFQKKGKSYFVYNNLVCEDFIPDKEIKDDSTVYCQVVKNDIFLKNIHIGKNALLHPSHLSISVKWKNLLVKRSTIAAVAGFLLLLPLSALFSWFNVFENKYLFIIMFLYMLFLFFLFSMLRKRELNSFFMDVEKDVLNDLSEQMRITSDSVSTTASRVKSIDNLMQISQRIIHEKDIVTLFDNIRKLTAKALDADRATVFIHDKKSHELSSGPGLSEEAHEFKIPENQGIAGEIFKLRKTINVSDAYNHPAFNRAVDKQTGYRTRTILGGPLLDLEGEIVGVIQVLNKKQGEFQKIDEQILETLATYIATALKDTLTIRNLEQRGIDPDVMRGLTSITRFIHEEHGIIENTVSSVDDERIKKILPRIYDVSLLLGKINFLFQDDFSVEKRPVSVGEMKEVVNNIAGQAIGANEITCTVKTTMPDDTVIDIDQLLYEKAIYEICTNSIESIGDKGEIRVEFINYVRIKSIVSHELAIMDIVSRYNIFSEENSIDFIDYLKSRKPLLREDVDKVEKSMTRYIGIIIYDNGQPVKDEIKNKVFNPFFTTKNKFGLGLAVVKTAVTRMGGETNELRQKGEWKSIRILLPGDRG